MTIAPLICVGQEMDMDIGRSGKIPAGSGTGPVAQPVFKADLRPTRPDTLEHALTRCAGISDSRLRKPNTLGHALTGFPGGPEMDMVHDGLQALEAEWA